MAASTVGQVADAVLVSITSRWGRALLTNERTENVRNGDTSEMRHKMHAMRRRRYLEPDRQS